MTNPTDYTITEACQPYHRRGDYEAIFAQLSRDDLEAMLVFLSGWDPVAFEAALRRTQR